MPEANLNIFGEGDRGRSDAEALLRRLWRGVIVPRVAANSTIAIRTQVGLERCYHATGVTFRAPEAER